MIKKLISVYYFIIPCIIFSEESHLSLQTQQQSTLQKEEVVQSQFQIQPTKINILKSEITKISILSMPIGFMFRNGYFSQAGYINYILIIIIDIIFIILMKWMVMKINEENKIVNTTSSSNIFTNLFDKFNVSSEQQENKIIKTTSLSTNPLYFFISKILNIIIQEDIQNFLDTLYVLNDVITIITIKILGPFLDKFINYPMIIMYLLYFMFFNFTPNLETRTKIFFTNSVFILITHVCIIIIQYIYDQILWKISYKSITLYLRFIKIFTSLIMSTIFACFVYASTDTSDQSNPYDITLDLYYLNKHINVGIFLLRILQKMQLLGWSTSPLLIAIKDFIAMKSLSQVNDHYKFFDENIIENPKKLIQIKRKILWLIITLTFVFNFYMFYKILDKKKDLLQIKILFQPASINELNTLNQEKIQDLIGKI